ncbi:uncharacterized protein LOC143028619 isoform X2 [Oratosquilla oratoria]|uniref:uncharacterized protein LOC143028619 isoform X2 n=1 Tax=Oratosquilla oratoria TaxID=337810 RepID=UPI003F776942
MPMFHLSILDESSHYNVSPLACERPWAKQSLTASLTSQKDDAQLHDIVPLGREKPVDPNENLFCEDEWLRLVEDEAELLLLASRIKEDLPFSASVHNLLRMTATTTCRPFFFFVPRQLATASRIVLYREETRAYWGVSCPPEELDALRQVLLRTNLLDVHAPRILFVHLSERTLEVINEVLLERTGIHPTIYTETTLYYMDDHEATKAPQPPLPGSGDNSKVCLLGEVGSRRMYDMWGHKRLIPFERIQHLSQELPALGVYLPPHRDTPAVPSEKTVPRKESLEEDRETQGSKSLEETKTATGVLEVFGILDTQETQLAVAPYPPEPTGWIPVSWITFSHLGSLGLLTTEEEHRGKGYARKVFLECARYMNLRGYEAFVHVTDGNDASHALMLKCGLTPCGKALWTQVNRPQTS